MFKEISIIQFGSQKFIPLRNETSHSGKAFLYLLFSKETKQIYFSLKMTMALNSQYGFLTQWHLFGTDRVVLLKIEIEPLSKKICCCLFRFSFTVILNFSVTHLSK